MLAGTLLQTWGNVKVVSAAQAGIAVIVHDVTDIDAPHT